MFYDLLKVMFLIQYKFLVYTDSKIKAIERFFVKHNFNTPVLYKSQNLIRLFLQIHLQITGLVVPVLVRLFQQTPEKKIQNALEKALFELSCLLLYLIDHQFVCILKRVHCFYNGASYHRPYSSGRVGPCFQLPDHNMSIIIQFYNTSVHSV